MKDDPKKYAARDDWFTGGWPGGEVGLKEGFAREDGAGASKSEMLPAGDVRRGRTPAVGASRDDWDADSQSGTLRSPSSDDAPGVPSRDDRFGATAAAVRAAKYALVKRLAALDRGVARTTPTAAPRTRWWRSSAFGGRGSAEPGEKIVRRRMTTWSARWTAVAPRVLQHVRGRGWRVAGVHGRARRGRAGRAPRVRVPALELGAQACDNVVRLGFGPQGASFTGEASLGHAYVVAGSTTRITFTGVTLESGAFGLPRVTLPTPLDALPEDAKEAAFGAGLQSGAFDTTFVDDDVRVSRGDRGETRVFVR